MNRNLLAVVAAAPFLLLPSLWDATLAAKEYSVTKTFKFTEDLYIEFGPLPTAIGPNESVETLMTALNEGFAQKFVEVWTNGIVSTLQDGYCTVDYMDTPIFSICDWKYPDRYDVDELPTPGQCYKHANGFVQRIYYKIERLEITCPIDFSYDDLDKDGYTAKAFSNDDFLNILNPPSEDGCDGDISTTCLFDSAQTAQWNGEGYEACNAELYINRFLDIEVYLKCLNEGYGADTANKIIEALDRYFELVVSTKVTQEILSVTPTSFVYNYASPYASDRKYCSHGAYYVDGNLVNQAPDSDGIYVTKFIVGFDLIWFKDREFDVDEDMPDVEVIINKAFQDGDFLDFLQKEYPEYYDEFVQDTEVCGVIDPGEAELTFAPTVEPTPKPTEGPACDVDTNEGCSQGQACRLPCALVSNEPECFDDELVRDCDRWGPDYICNDSDGDGTITSSDHGNGCKQLPPPKEPTEFPTLAPVITVVVTPSPTVTNASRTPVPSSGGTDTVDKETTASPTTPKIRPAETKSPTTPPVKSPTTPPPTCPKCIVYPDDTEEDECPYVTVGTCGDGKRGDGICPYEGHCCSKWGYCGTTAEYCDSSPAPAPGTDGAAPTSPTYSVGAGQCAGGDVGDGFCPDKSLCCSQWGYCGEGEQYCYTTRVYDKETGEDVYDGTCGGGGVGDGKCKFGKCCSQFGFCGDTELHCTGLVVQSDASAEDEAKQIINRSPLPPNLKPQMGFRCGVSEVDARSNCKPECTHLIQCAEGEECWGIQLNYCNTFVEGEHPVCTNLDLADTDSRCGYDEASARGHCGPKCNSDSDCGQGEFCFPTLLNLCECHEGTCPEKSTVAFNRAKSLISPYFVEEDPNNAVEGKPRNASCTLSLNGAVLFVMLSASMKILNMV